MKHLLKIYYWGEKLMFWELRFSRFKKFVTMSVLGSTSSLNFKTSCCNKNQRSRSKTGWLLFSFYLEGSDGVLKPNNSCILLSKNINCDKNKMKLKMENPTHTVLERQSLCFSSYKIWKLKVKLRGIFCIVYFVRGNFLTFVFYLNL